jgi:hypothetical protein
MGQENSCLGSAGGGNILHRSLIFPRCFLRWKVDHVFYPKEHES